MIAVLIIYVFFWSPLPFSPGRLPNFGERKIVSNTLPLQEQWQYKTDGSVRQISSQSDQVYAWHGGRISALNAGTGKEEWTFPGNSGLGLLTAVGDNAVAFVPALGLGSPVNVLDATTGHLMWKTPLYDPRSLTIGGGRLYVGATTVSAFDLKSGQLAWKMSKELPSHTSINVFYDSMTLYIVAEDHMYILDAQDGHILKSFEARLSIVPAIAEDTIFGVVRAHYANATDIGSGRLLWTKNVHPYGFPPVLISDTLYVITDNLDLLALNPETGEQKWQSQTVQQPFSDIVDFNGLGYVLSNTGRLYGFDLMTGQAVGILDTGAGLPFDFGNDLEPSLEVAGETLVFSFGDSPIYAFEAANLH